MRLKSCTNFCEERGQPLLSLKIRDAKSASLLRCPAIDRDTIGDVSFAFILSANARISRAARLDFDDNFHTQLTVGVLSQ